MIKHFNDFYVSAQKFSLKITLLIVFYNSNMSHIKYISDIQYISEVDDTFTQNTDRGHFGKLKVLFNRKLCTITIGPDYCFFIPAFCFFLILGIVIINIVFKNSDDIFFRLLTILICLGQPLSYLNVALSNPGIVSHSILDIPVEEVSTIDGLETQAEQRSRPKSNKHKYCKHCNIYVKQTTFHCGDCQLCIEEYDHHCPWVSKCIGKHNLCKFYLFLAMTPVFMIYSFISFFACMAIELAQQTTVKG